eukprot:2496065-Pyramimonas_sp.AAC.1
MPRGATSNIWSERVHDDVARVERAHRTARIARVVCEDPQCQILHLVGERVAGEELAGALFAVELPPMARWHGRGLRVDSRRVGVAH